MVFCEICKREFKDYRTLSTHITMLHKGKEIKSIEDYYRKYINDEVSVCDVCKKHVKFQNLQNGYNKVCSKKCASTIASPNKIKCYLCDKIFSNKVVLEKHLEESHNLNEKSKIEYFIKYINTIDNLICDQCKNTKKLCNFEKGLYCESCIHFKCEICGDILGSLKLLQFHINKHVKNKECESLEKYYLIYIGKQEYCLTCGKALKFIGSLKSPYFKYCPGSCSSLGSRSKFKETCQERYGVDNPLQVDEFKTKSSEASLKKYGTSNPASSQVIKDKIKNTFIEKYGKNPMLTEETKEKIKTTCLKRYGVDSPMKTEEVKEKVKQSMFKKYGVYYSSQNQEIKLKIKKTKIKNDRIKHYNRILKICQRRHITTLFTKEDYLNIQNKTFKFKCDICGDVFYLKDIIVAMYPRCIKCFPSERSQFEMEFNSWMSSVYNGEMIYNDRNIIKPKEIDVFLPSLGIGIELNGIYYHSDLFMSHKYHINKTIDCLNQNINLLHVFESEFLEKEEIVKSIILNKLGKTTERVFARKTTFRKLDKEESKKFFNDNHLQGYTKEDISFGLFHKSELVSAISFAKKGHRHIFGNRMSESNESELLRFCNKLNLNVVGSFSKLFKNSIKDVFFKDIDKVMTFANVRYSPSYQETVYIKNGFKYLKTTEPGYWYHYKNRLYHRYNFRKDILLKMFKDLNMEIFDDDTEFSLADRLGLIRIYDCGNHKFEYEL